MWYIQPDLHLDVGRVTKRGLEGVSGGTEFVKGQFRVGSWKAVELLRRVVEKE